MKNIICIASASMLSIQAFAVINEGNLKQHIKSFGENLADLQNDFKAYFSRKLGPELGKNKDLDILLDNLGKSTDKIIDNCRTFRESAIELNGTLGSRNRQIDTSADNLWIYCNFITGHYRQFYYSSYFSTDKKTIESNLKNYKEDINKAKAGVPDAKTMYMPKRKLAISVLNSMFDRIIEDIDDKLNSLK